MTITTEARAILDGVTANEAASDAVARLLYERDPIIEGGEYVDGFKVTPDSALRWEDLDDDALSYYRAMAHDLPTVWQALEDAMRENERLKARVIETLEPFRRADEAISQYDATFPENGAALRASFDWFAMADPNNEDDTAETLLQRRACTRGHLKAAADLHREVVKARAALQGDAK